MAKVQGYSVVRSSWPNEEGELYWTITDGAEQRGEFATKQAAIDNLEKTIINWQNRA